MGALPNTTVIPSIEGLAKTSDLSSYLLKSGGTMSGPLVLTGGDAISGVGNMQLSDTGQITKQGTNATLFGMSEGQLIIGHGNYNTKFRGKQTRPVYNNAEVAMYSDLNYNNLTNKPTIPTNTSQLTNGSGFITSAGSMQTLYSGTATSGTITLSQNLVSSSKDLIVFFWINDEDIYQTLAIPESTLYSINSSTYNLAFRSTTASTNKTMTLHRSGANTLQIDSNSSSYIKLKNVYRMHLN